MKLKTIQPPSRYRLEKTFYCKRKKHMLSKADIEDILEMESATHRRKYPGVVLKECNCIGKNDDGSVTYELLFKESPREKEVKDGE